MAIATSEKSWAVPWWMVLIQGIALVFLGLLLLFWPAATTVVLIQVLGIYWLISGIMSIVWIFVDHSKWGWKLLSGILGIIAGILILQHPLWSTILVPATLVILFGILGVVNGIVALIAAYQGGGWGAGVLGVLSIIFGIILLANTLISAVLLPFVFAGFAIVGGIAAIINAFQIKS
jgi:uncharacterized membrane protein HdeD (DUF308 family)